MSAWKGFTSGCENYTLLFLIYKLMVGEYPIIIKGLYGFNCYRYCWLGCTFFSGDIIIVWVATPSTHGPHRACRGKPYSSTCK